MIGDELRDRIESAVKRINARSEYPSCDAVGREIGRSHTNCKLHAAENEIRKEVMRRLQIPIKINRWHAA